MDRKIGDGIPMSKIGTLLLSVMVVLGCNANGERGRGGSGSETGGIGADGGTDNANPATPRLGMATVRGIVWAPGNAPGMVPAGQEIPVYDALIQVSVQKLPPIPQMAYCDRCEMVTGFSGKSDHAGGFELVNLVPQEYWLTIQKGQFRIERRIMLAENEVLDLSQEMTTLPSVHNPDQGDWVPRIGVASGNFDHIEDVLGKMKIGDVDGLGEYTVGNGTDAIDFYENGGREYNGHMEGTMEGLVRDLGRMMQYHIIFVPCAGSAHTNALQDRQVLQNIRDYVAAGGKLYVTDWSGEWMDNVFPAFVTLGAGEDTPASAYDATTGTWNPLQFGDANGSRYDSHNGEVVDDNLFQWLNGQMGPPAEGLGNVTYDASHFDVIDNWNVIEDMTRVEIGVDDEGLPVLEEPKAWVIGGEGNATPKKPLTVTFEPAGCGRVLYSTYHTTDESHVGLVPQERILLYLIMEIGICNDGPILI